MRNTLKITSKGQVTLRKEVLDQLGVKPGDRIIVEPVGPGRVELRPARSGPDLADFIGCLQRPKGRRLSLAVMKKVGRDSWAGKR